MTRIFVSSLIATRLAVAAFGATGFSREKLAAESPFASSETTASTTPDTTCEVRGFFGSGDTAEVSLWDKAAGRAEWVAVGDTFGDWTLRAADASAGTVALTCGVREISVSLAQASPPGATDALAQPASGISALNAEQRGAVAKGITRLIDEHPEYLTASSPADRAAFSAARRQVYAAVVGGSASPAAGPSPVSADSAAASPGLPDSGSPAVYSPENNALASASAPNAPAGPEGAALESAPNSPLTPESSPAIRPSPTVIAAGEPLVQFSDINGATDNYSLMVTNIASAGMDRFFATHPEYKNSPADPVTRAARIKIRRAAGELVMQKRGAGEI